MSTVIAAESLSKKYIIGHQPQERFTTLRDALANGARRFTHKLRHPFSAPENDPAHEEFWALRDVCFDIQQGDRVGIIGRNGAGKSTLLKILSRITEPTSGKVSIKGRVASLLEVGTGFHPELTGRENIFLNGAILGMSKAEIKNKFDEIVDFAEVEKFIDTPVKRYSSGMYVRLAFAVAAHLEPEILILDEVLAVGDAQFQQKCMGRMGEASQQGKTVIFVSHNMDAISALCNKGIILDKGRITYEGEVGEALKTYMASNNKNQYTLESCTKRVQSGGIRMLDVWIENHHGHIINEVDPESAISLGVKIEIDENYIGRNIDVGFGVDAFDGRRLFTTLASWCGAKINSNARNVIVKCSMKTMPLVPNKYLLSASLLCEGHTLDVAFHCASFYVLNRAGKHYFKIDKDHGDFFVPFEFESHEASDASLTKNILESDGRQYSNEVVG